MDTITGSHLISTTGEDIGEITDVVGSSGPDITPAWIAVKTGWFSQRLVPFNIVVEDGDDFRTDCTPEDVKAAPKVPVHFEPAGHDLEALCEHYRVSLV